MRIFLKYTPGIILFVFLNLIFTNSAFAAPFISTWDTTQAGSASTTIVLPMTGTYIVDWGDTSTSSESTTSTTSVSHVYSSATTSVTISVTGTITGFSFNNAGDKLKIKNISQWGDLKLGNAGGYFYGCSNLKITATDVIDLTGTTYMSSAFRSSGIDTVPSMNSWDMSQVTITEQMFRSATLFNQDISAWDTSSVTHMGAMFLGATSFNQNIGNWNTSNVTRTDFMFNNATSFNQNIGNWDTSKVTTMSNMFNAASSFNNGGSPSINNWNTASTTNMSSMFFNTTPFNQPVVNWNVGKVTNMSQMFRASSFDQNIGNWNITSVASTTSITTSFYNTPLSTVNWSLILIGWSQQNVKTGISITHSSKNYYTGPATTARGILTGTYGWVITGDSAITSPTYTLSYTTGSNGTLTGSTTQAVLFGASSTAVTAVPNTGYDFVNWSDGSTSNPRTETLATSSISVTANFATSTYTLSYVAGANGTLTGSTTQVVAYGGNGTEVTAVPDTTTIHYHLDHWSDGATSTSRTDTNVTSNLTVTAIFATHDDIIEYIAGPNGTLTGSTTQDVFHGASTTPVTAVPNGGYHFVNWSDGSTDNPRHEPYADGPLSVTANFEKTPRKSSGSSVKTRIANLIDMGKTKEAQTLATQFPQVTPSQTTLNTNTFTRDLEITLSGEDVKALQNILISKGYSIPAGATGYFGGQTQAALIKYQQDNKITPARGYFGAITRAQMRGMGISI